MLNKVQSNCIFALSSETMMRGKEVYEVVSAVVPLYTAMLLAYASVRWWKIFTQEQCDGINRFVAVFAFPLLALRSISAINLYHLNLPFVASDFIHKVVVLVALFLWHAFSRRCRRLDWVITIFSISTLPNNLVIGVALLRAMHGDASANLMVQVFVLQFAFWYTVLDFLYEYRAAHALVSETFPGVAASIASFKVDADVVSLSGGDHPLDTDVEVDDNGRVYAIVRRSSSNLSKSGVCPSSTLSKLPSGQQSVIHGAGDLSYVEMDWGRSFSCDFSINRGGRVTDCHYPIHSPMSMRSVSLRFMERDGGGGRRSNLRLADLNRATATAIDFATMIIDHDTTTPIDGARGHSQVDEAPGGQKLLCRNRMEEAEKRGDGSNHAMPSRGVMTRLIFAVVCKKLIRNPKTYASIIAIVWSLVSYRWDLQLPKMVQGSISIMADTGQAMTMFSLGLFTAQQTKLIPCGYSMGALSLVLKFLFAPVLSAGICFVIGIRGTLFRDAVIQAALPLSTAPFVYAKEYDCQADVLSTSVLFGTLVAVPIALIYSIVLDR